MQASGRACRAGSLAPCWGLSVLPGLHGWCSFFYRQPGPNRGCSLVPVRSILVPGGVGSGTSLRHWGPRSCSGQETTFHLREDVPSRILFSESPLCCPFFPLPSKPQLLVAGGGCHQTPPGDFPVSFFPPSGRTCWWPWGPCSLVLRMFPPRLQLPAACWLPLGAVPVLSEHVCPWTAWPPGSGP